MTTILANINTYRIRSRIPMTTLASEIGLDPGTVRNALLGITKPHDYNMPAFEKYYNDHRAEIEEAVSGSTAQRIGTGCPTGSLS